MKKTIVGLGVLLILVCAAPLFAQGAFTDVPTDHWAYDAINQLQEDGILIGYPDGTFQGRRALTRFEFAVAIARMIPVLEQNILAQIPAASGGVSQADFDALKARVDALEARPGGGVSTEQFTALQNDVKALQDLVNEFRDELAGLGVDVDALKRDVASLAARMDAVEKELARVRFTGNVNIHGIATATQEGQPFGLDGRPFQPEGPAAGELINAISFVTDADLVVTGSLSPAITAVADINYGNYLPSYLGGIVNDYVGTERPTSGLADEFTPYFMYVEAGLGSGSLQVGRIPVQFTPYTLKMIDVDSYSVNDKTDSGNYPLDGAKLNWRLGGVNINAFAAKTNNNNLLLNDAGLGGLIAQPTVALYDDSGISPAAVVTGAFHDAGGHAAGGLDLIDQAAGVHAVIGTPFAGNLGLTYMRAAGPVAQGPGSWDTVNVLGADGRWQFGRFMLAAEYAQTDTESEFPGVADIDDDNRAIDAKLGFGLGKLGVDLGWRSVEHNFAAPGAWDKVGMWTNPTNVEGPYLNLNYGLTSNVNLVASGSFYEGANTVGGLPAVINSTDDELWNAKIGLKWGLGSNSLNLGWERVRWSPDGGSDTDEDYITIGFAREIGASAGFSISYQIVDYDPAGAITPYGTSSYEGGVAVAQLRARF